MSRNLVDVLDEIIKTVPDNQNNQSFLTSLDDIKSSAAMAAPEAMILWWAETQELLIGEFPDPDGLSGWQQSVVDIFMGNPP